MALNDRVVRALVHCSRCFPVIPKRRKVGMLSRVLRRNSGQSLIWDDLENIHSVGGLFTKV